MTTAASITVRVQALNRKFLGDDIGGAHVSIRDARTRKVLAEGVTDASGPNYGELIRDSPCFCLSGGLRRSDFGWRARRWHRLIPTRSRPRKDASIDHTPGGYVG